MPETEKDWTKLSDEIMANWQFLNSIGAMDGKHIPIFSPAHIGSTFYNYKGFYSIVLLALVKHNYQFLYANIGCQGRIIDGGLSKYSDMYRSLKSNSLSLPKLTPFHKTYPIP